MQITDKEKKMLEFLLMLYAEGFQKICTESLFNLSIELMGAPAICTVLKREGFVDYPNGIMKGWRWIGIRPNIEMVRVLLRKVTEYQTACQNGKLNNGSAAKKNYPPPPPVQEEKKHLEKNLRPAHKIQTSKDARIYFMLASLLSKLDVLPTAEELQQMITDAREMQRNIFN